MSLFVTLGKFRYRPKYYTNAKPRYYTTTRPRYYTTTMPRYDTTTRPRYDTTTRLQTGNRLVAYGGQASYQIAKPRTSVQALLGVAAKNSYPYGYQPATML